MYFIPVACFLLFNVMDWAGRSLTAVCMWVSKKTKHAFSQQVSPSLTCSAISHGAQAQLQLPIKFAALFLWPSQVKLYLKSPFSYIPVCSGRAVQTDPATKRHYCLPAHFPHQNILLQSGMKNKTHYFTLERKPLAS